MSVTTTELEIRLNRVTSSHEPDFMSLELIDERNNILIE